MIQDKKIQISHAKILGPPSGRVFEVLENCPSISSVRDSRSALVGVISKVLRILEALNASPAGLCLRDVAKLTGLNKSTAYRFLAHLESEGYLFRDESGAYSVGPRLARRRLIG